MKKTILENVALAGTAAGIISGLVKLGWENILPPRTSARNKVNPPQTLLQQMGIPAKYTQATYTYSGEKLPWVSYLVHFGFSITFATAYAFLLEKKVKLLTIGQGVPFGIAIWIAFHLVIMPKLNTVPSVKKQPWQEHLSESAGHAVWMLTNHIVLKDVLKQLKNK